jgi:hypothetical protein
MITDTSNFNNCIPASMTSDFNLHMPELVFGSISFTADIQFVAGGDTGSSTDIMFKLTDAKLIEYITGDSYTLASGSRKSLEGALIIDVTNNVDISGVISASNKGGQPIIIRAGGNVNLSGALTGGNGASGFRGGDIGIISKNGNITITSYASLTAGSGGAGTYVNNGKIEGGAGGIGGTIYIITPNGTATIPDKAGLFRIGNGGRGADISINGNDLLTATIPTQMPNGGGSSGGFDIRAKTISGLAYTTETTTTDIKDPVSGEVLIPANTTLMLLSSTTQFSGGEGADAGSLNYGTDVEGNSTWPAMPAWTVENREKIPAVRKAVSYSTGDINITGKDGGDGILGGGDGEDLAAEASEGYFSVNVIGGAGGSCATLYDKVFINCTPGRGGNARANGGKGKDAITPGIDGGAGGEANATGGDAGLKYYSLGVSTTGSPGQAWAYGGKGGVGGGSCPSNVVSSGGKGGKGGQAMAKSGRSFIGGIVGFYGNVSAYGGDGGRGGDGSSESGTGGEGGFAVALTDGNYSSEHGVNGAAGSVCSSTCGCNDSGVTFSLGTDCGKDWKPAINCTTWKGDPGTTYTTGATTTQYGCTMSIHCP